MFVFDFVNSTAGSPLGVKGCVASGSPGGDPAAPWPQCEGSHCQSGTASLCLAVCRLDRPVAARFGAQGTRGTVCKSFCVAFCVGE